MLDHGKIDFRRGPQRIAHRGFVEDRLAIIGDGDGASPLQSAEVGEHGTFAGLRSRRDREDVDYGPTLRLPHPGYPFRRIKHWGCIWHATTRREASRRRSRGPGRNRFLVALAGLAQMHM